MTKTIKEINNQATINRQEVYKILTEIPLGFVTTYKIITNTLKNRQKISSNAIRAVATIIGKNQNLIQIPCHRVVLSSGEIGNYARGAEEKISLLKQEGIIIKNNKIANINQQIYRFPNDL